ncbi:hypothetical protein [Dialister sp.]|uniref:hypothetical protein n=1 Tax=Dialister sp. TaxID=1955814 RepID=UPI003F12840D
MNRRKGSLTLPLLLFLTALLTLSAGFISWQGRSRESLLRYQKGLASVYAAESGAGWALAALARGQEKKEISFTVNERTVHVSFPSDGEILSMAEDERRDYRRYVKLTCSVEEAEGKKKITVEDIRSDR